MKHYRGYIALIGRPNVGKSTLLNYIMQQKISITSRKPQTTRHRILGIKTIDPYQFLYVDTPGIHSSNKTLNKLMNKTAIAVLRDVDVILFITEALVFTKEDGFILDHIKSTQTPCILVINKVDKISNKKELLPWIEQMSAMHPFKRILPISAKNGSNVTELEEEIQQYIPSGPYLFPEDQITDRSLKFLCAELLREKIFRFYGDELPYSSTVEIESFKEEEDIIRIHILIFVDKMNQRRIIIGEKGEKLKQISTQARLEMEQLLDKKVFLRCWCKVKSGWNTNERMLKQLGYE